MKGKLFLLSKMLTIIFVILFGIVLTAHTILMENAAAISSYFGVRLQDTIPDPDAANKDSEYFKSEFDSVAALKERGAELIEEVVGEGAVLLENKSVGGRAALPLEKGDKVSLFSASSVDLVTSGAGSSGGGLQGIVRLKEAFEAPEVGLTVNADLWKWYDDNKETYGRTSVQGIGITYSIKDAPWSNIPEDVKNQRAKAGIFVLSRKGSEGVDVGVNASLNGGDPNDMTNGDYLDLSPNEITVLKGMKALKDSGTLSEIIVLMNSANQVQTDFMENPDYGVDALLWCGTLGTNGAEAVADILVGNTNPSGRLADTFWTRHRYNPVYANYGSFAYSSGSSMPYVVYQEGIYNGYRYTETRYADKVLARPKTGDFDYREAVSYPFGYGLSYTGFVWSDFSVTPHGDGYTVSVKVTNTGTVAGKDVVEVYLQKPYTDYDIENHIEKAAVELVGYGKTELLAPNASAVVTVEVDGKSFASYDAYGAKTYIVDAGEYALTAARDAHAAVNNILTKQGRTTADGMTEAGDTAFVHTVTKSFDKQMYATSTLAMENHIKKDATEITNRFDDADVNRNPLMEGQTVTYLSRNDWEGTVRFGLGEHNESLNNQVVLSASAGILPFLAETAFEPQPDDTPNPTFGSDATSWSLIDLRAYADDDNDVSNDVPIEYDNEMWEQLLDQLSWREMTTLLSTGFRLTMAVSSVNKPLTIDHNGSVGVVQLYGANSGTNRGLAVRKQDPDRNSYPPLYPCNGLVASTYNDELIEEYGEHWGEDGLWAGYSGLYGPGCNTHRSAYGGRTYEYYSEDPFLGGTMCADVVRGMKSKGMYAYLKHAILNDQELSRGSISTFANEQTIREIYLKQFEIAIVEGGASNVMTGYNKVGAKWTGFQGFCNSVLRDEFGMTGFAVTDYIGGDQTGRMTGAIQLGQDLPDQDFSAKKIYDKYADGYGNVVTAMRESCHRILYTVVHSNAMNGITSGTRVVLLTPAWVVAADAVTIAAGVLCGASVIFLAVVLIIGNQSKKEKYHEKTE